LGDVIYDVIYKGSCYFKEVKRSDNMRIRLLSLITLLTLSLIISSCVEQTPVQSPEPTISPPEPEIVTPTPVFEANTGHVTGRVVYVDGAPASQVGVYIFKRGAFMSTARATVKANGDYYFSGLPVGDYEIYAAIYKDYSLEIPDAKISVYDQQVTTVSLIIVPREVEFSFGDDYPVNKPLSISWEPTTNAYKYTVTIASNLDAASPGPIGYNNVATTSQTSLIWPALQLGGYEITIRAFDQNDTLIGIGKDFFTIVSTP
jgi:hypothetical protein